MLASMLVRTTLGRAKDLVKQVLSDRNGTIAFGRVLCTCFHDTHTHTKGVRCRAFAHVTEVFWLRFCLLFVTSLFSHHDATLSSRFHLSVVCSSPSHFIVSQTIYSTSIFTQFGHAKR